MVLTGVNVLRQAKAGVAVRGAPEPAGADIILFREVFVAMVSFAGSSMVTANTRYGSSCGNAVALTRLIYRQVRRFPKIRQEKFAFQGSGFTLRQRWCEISFQVWAKGRSFPDLSICRPVG